jgi:hypothetical protein
MSSETSTKGVQNAAPVAGPSDDRVPGFQPWHLFVIGTLIASAASAVAVRGTRPANVVFVCLTVIAAGVAAYAVYRTLWPLVEPDAVDTPEMLGGRTRAALEREKTLVLRAIKELEFDRAMGKVSEPDFQEMTARLRGRAVRLIRQLDSGSAAYREVIEKELAARQASGARNGEKRREAGGAEAGATNAAARALAIVFVLGSLAFGTPVSAQMGGTGGMAGMPDAKAMSGIPRPDGASPAGAVSVRLVRGQLSNLIAGHPVEFIVNGQSQSVKTDETGHAVIRGLPPGATVHVVTTVDGERLDSQDFQVLPDAGVVLMLVATDKTAAEQMAREAVAGTVTLGGQTRIVTQFEDEVLQVYYLFDFVNAASSPVKVEPLVFTLPNGAKNASVLEGSAPNAVAKGPSFIVSGPFAPGVTTVQLAYALDPAARVAIRQSFPVALAQVAVMIEKVGAMVVSSPQMTTIREGNEGGKAFVLGMGPGLKPGAVLAMDITGLPHQPTWPRTVALALAVLVLTIGAWGAFRTGGRSAAAAARQQLERRREKVFGELLRLEQQKKAGKLDDEGYAEKRRDLVGELERIYGELDTEAQGPRGDQGLAA